MEHQIILYDKTKDHFKNTYCNVELYHNKKVKIISGCIEKIVLGLSEGTKVFIIIRDDESITKLVVSAYDTVEINIYPRVSEPFPNINLC